MVNSNNINKNINRTIGIITIFGCFVYDLYLGYQFSNNSFYHLKPNTFYFAPPSPLPYYIIVIVYSFIAIFAGLFLIRRKRICLHFYHMLFLGLIIINSERLIFTYYADGVERIIGNVFSIVVSAIGLLYINGKVVWEYLCVTKFNRLKLYPVYVLISGLLLIVFKINVW